MHSNKQTLYTIFIGFLLSFSNYLITDEFSFLSWILFTLLALFTSRLFMLFLAFSNLCYQLFYTYFQREWQSSDFYNFFTHTQETFETMRELWMLFSIPFGLFLIITLFIFFKPAPLKHKKIPLLLLIPLSVLILPPFRVIPSFLHISDTPLLKEEKNLIPLRKPNQNIVLIIGESMKYDKYVQKKLKKLGFFYKKIYAGATNTDVSLSLLFNAKIDPLALGASNKTNLFALAKKSGYQTAFISIQTAKSLQYILPFIQKEKIDYFKTYTKKSRRGKYDFYLLEELKKLDLKKPHFIVLQQIGEHSPYRYFPGKKSKSPRRNYQKSIDYSFKLYKAIYKYLKKSNQPFTLLYTSDHGEFTGEKKRWGHNSFEKEVYEVPLFYTSTTSLPKEFQSIQSHYHLSQAIIYLLGYGRNLNLTKEPHIVNGTMLTREDGYIELP